MTELVIIPKVIVLIEIQCSYMGYNVCASHHMHTCPIAAFRARTRRFADRRVWGDNEEKSRGGDEGHGCQISIDTPLYWQGHLNTALSPPSRINCWDSIEPPYSVPKAMWAAAQYHSQEKKKRKMDVKLSSRLSIGSVIEGVSAKGHFIQPTLSSVGKRVWGHKRDKTFKVSRKEFDGVYTTSI